jgi:hypothetical protein
MVTGTEQMGLLLSLQMVERGGIFITSAIHLMNGLK